MTTLITIQKILLVPLTLISLYIIIQRIFYGNKTEYLEWQFPMLLALVIDVFLLKN